MFRSLGAVAKTALRGTRRWQKPATLGLIGMALTGLAACDQTPTGSDCADRESNGSTDGAAMPANGPGRLRGTLATIDSNTMTVTTYDGASMHGAA